MRTPELISAFSGCFAFLKYSDLFNAKRFFTFFSLFRAAFL